MKAKRAQMQINALEINFQFIIVKKPDVHTFADWEKKSMTEHIDRELKKMGITVSKPILAILCIVFGLLIILFPSLLVWIAGLFLLIQGILLLTDYLELKR